MAKKKVSKKPRNTNMFKQSMQNDHNDQRNLICKD